MKKLVIFVDSLKRDGAERVSVNLAKYMNENNIETTIITEWVSEEEYDVPQGVNRINLDAKKNKYLNYFKNVNKFNQILKNIDPDLMLVMDLPGCLLSIPASKKLDIKVIVSERNDPTHFPGKKIIALIARKLMSLADGFVFQTEGAMSFYKKMVKGRGIIIPNPIFVESLPNYFDGKREKTIVTAGRLTQQKNQKLLLSSFKKVNEKHRDYKLIIYGEGELRNNLSQQIKSLGLDNVVKLPGNEKKLLEKINSAGIFVMPSNFEGMPNALLEAMALGLPVISTDCPCGGPKAVIQNEVNGLLVPVEDENAMTNSILYLIENQEKANEMGRNALEIRNTLSSNIICKRWKDYMDSLC